MSTRSRELQAFIDAAEAAFAARANNEPSKVSVSLSFAALTRARDNVPGAASRLSVCDKYLSIAADPNGFSSPDLNRLVEAFRLIDPMLNWRRRTGAAPRASSTFHDGHANAMIVGPGGLEPRTDVWIGVSLLAPHVRYPDHRHPPQETYLVMSPGQFAQDSGPWFEPGIGGTLYNSPGIRHAMRAGPKPLFAFWLLQSADANA